MFLNKIEARVLDFYISKALDWSKFSYGTSATIIIKLYTNVIYITLICYKNFYFKNALGILIIVR